MRGNRGDRELTRQAEILGALSLATDLSAGNPPGATLAATTIAVRIGRAMGLSETDLRVLYYAGILRFIGCTSTSEETSEMTLGDELTGYLAFTRSDPVDAASVEAELLAIWAPTKPMEERRALIDAILAMGPDVLALGHPHCVQAMALARRLPVPEGVVDVLRHLECRWDGQHPIHPPGPELAPAPLIIEFAVVAELHRRAGGPVSMLEVARARRGGQFAPRAVDALLEDPAGILDGLGPRGEWDTFLAAEPGAPLEVGPGGRRRAAEAMADFTDLKCRWFTGHSRKVAGLAFRAATEAGRIGEDAAQGLFDAGLLHDIGKNAVPNGIWTKPGPLTPLEDIEARTASFHTERILGLAPAFHDICDVACSAGERRDGSGFHRGTRLEDPRAAHLAVANLYDELTSDQPARAAMAPGEAAETLLAEVHAGRLPRAEVAAVLDCAGSGAAARDVWPDGMTKREAEVLRELARGKSNKEIARALGIAPKTVDNHLQNLFAKIGAESRTAAALYAMERGLFSI